MVNKVSREQIVRAQQEIEEEDRQRWARTQADLDSLSVRENARRSRLSLEHPDHICGMMCDVLRSSSVEAFWERIN